MTSPDQQGSLKKVHGAELLLRQRPSDGHKGTFGRVLLLGGSVGMSGSICLAGVAALRSGAGLVAVAVPDFIQPIVAGFEPSYTTIGLETRRNGSLKHLSPAAVRGLLSGRSAVGIGPGLGQTHAAVALVGLLMQHCDLPLVMDADALNVAAANGLLDRSELWRPDRIITPHPGEFSRLTGLSTDVVNQDRADAAMRLAREKRLIVVLKGAGTIVTNGQRLYVNDTGNSGMATGGSGDVLTGIITALLAQGVPLFEAAAIGVRVHGIAGDIVASETSERGLIASDLLKALPHTWRLLEPNP
ncbi:MAG: NAD(P)H-hydrate dehydratase [Planctomycetaceae bacterium]